MAKKPFPQADVYGLLEPGPVVLLSTAYKKQANGKSRKAHKALHHLGKGKLMAAGEVFKLASLMR
jgi:hypothetical protein